MTTDMLPGLFDEIPAAPKPLVGEPVKVRNAMISAHTDGGRDRLPDWAQDILENVTVEFQKEKWVAKLNSGQLQPEHYAKIKALFSNIGGKWVGGKTAGFTFSFDPSEVILAIQSSGCMPEKNPLDFFPTPKPLLRRLFEDSESAWMFSLFDNPAMGEADLPLILEPSAGGGSIAEVIGELYPGTRGHIDTVELNPINVRSLRRLQSDGLVREVFEDNFLNWTPPAEERSHRIAVMNPPFSYKGNSTVFIDHIQHAWEIVTATPGRPGILIAITPQSWLAPSSNAKLSAFRDFVFQNGSFAKIEAGEFKESGTSVATAVIFLQWDGEKARLERQECKLSQLMMYIENDSELFEKMEWVRGELANADLMKNADANLEGLFDRAAASFLSEFEDGIPKTPLVLQAFRDYITRA